MGVATTKSFPSDMVSFLTLKQIVFLGLFTALLALTGCGSSQPKPQSDAQANGKPSETSARYELLANQARDETQRAVYQYLAAQAWYKEGFQDRAFFLFVNLNPSLLSPEYRLDRNITLADFYSARGKPALALKYLEDQQVQIDLRSVDSSEKSRWAAITADLSALLGNYDRAVKIYDFALSYAEDDERSQLRSNLWRSLTLIDHTPTGPYLSSETSGWVALAEINNQSTGSVSDQYLSYLLWQDRYYDHPARISPPASFAVLEKIAAGDRPKVAILLPLTGPLASAGQAILDGYISARATEYQKQSLDPIDPLAPSMVKIFDTNATSLYSIVRDIQEQQFDLVIGPLDKDRVADYANLMPDIPTLALNSLPTYTDATGIENNSLLKEKPILGLSLNVEDEAYQAAVKALQAGHQRAMVLVPNSSWGDRAGFAFSDFWQAEGGKVTAFKSYSDTPDDTALLGNSLHANQSEARKQGLQQLLGKNLEFTPRRRQDIDALFLAASPAQARQLKPMLAYFFAETIPVYSTSSVYSGLPDPKADRDLDGIQFSTLPWVLDSNNALRTSLTEGTAASATSLKMQAIGVDSYYLSQRLIQFIEAPDTVYRGVTGKLGRSPETNNLDRKQVWAEFNSGRAAPISN